MFQFNSISVSIIIVSYNTKKYLQECLKSISTHLKSLRHEVIVVDNASTDGSLEMLKRLERQKNLKLISLKNNLGFGAANNRGVAQAQGKYLLLLNSDTLFIEDALSQGIDFLEKQSDFAAYSCQLQSPNGSTQANGGFFPNLKNILYWQLFIDDLPLFSRLIKSVHPHPYFYHQPQQLDWLTGAFFLVSREKYCLINGFDENIFMYAEELELCYRLKRLGGGCYYSPDKKIIHYGGASGTSGLAIGQEIKNLVYFFSKHRPPEQLFWIKSIFRLGCLLRWFLFGIIKGNVVAKNAYIKAYRQLA